MHLHLPRCYRRKLFFPPGLLALAGALLLACVQLVNSPQLKHFSVIQLTMLSLHKPAGEDFSDFWISPQKLAVIRKWQTFYLNGQIQKDSIVVNKVIGLIPALQDSNDYTSGVKVVFGRYSKYREFIQILNIVNVSQIRHYAFEIRTGQPTMYIFKDKPLVYRERPFICGNPAEQAKLAAWTEANLRQAEADLRQTKFWQISWLEAFKQKEWRTSVYMLACICLIGSWRMLKSGVCPS